MCMQSCLPFAIVVRGSHDEGAAMSVNVQYRQNIERMHPRQMVQIARHVPMTDQAGS